MHNTGRAFANTHGLRTAFAIQWVESYHGNPRISCACVCPPSHLEPHFNGGSLGDHMLCDCGGQHRSDESNKEGTAKREGHGSPRQTSSPFSMFRSGLTLAQPG